MKQLLLIEDDASVTRVVLKNLSEKSYKTNVVNRLYLAIEFLQKPGADLVLLDMSCPDVENLKGVKSLIETFPNVPLIILVDKDDQNAALALKAGAKDYILKNEYLAGVLESRIQKVLGQYRQSVLDEIARCKASLHAFEELGLDQLSP